MAQYMYQVLHSMSVYVKYFTLRQCTFSASDNQIVVIGTQHDVGPPLTQHWINVFCLLGTGWDDILLEKWHWTHHSVEARNRADQYIRLAKQTINTARRRVDVGPASATLVQRRPDVGDLLCGFSWDGSRQSVPCTVRRWKMASSARTRKWLRVTYPDAGKWTQSRKVLNYIPRFLQ